ncbi:MAG: penicillin-binding protein 2 [Robiginitomaculum sp.]|nr:penicillin-binding protein 2 [Robiginitomaculum sp.]
MKNITPDNSQYQSHKTAFFEAVPSLSVQDIEHKSIRQARVRIIMGLGIFTLFLFLLIVRLVEVSVFKSPIVFTVMKSNQIKPRADIEDRNGALLATTLETYSVFADPRKVWDIEASTEAIISVLPDLDAAIVEERLSSEKSFVWIQRNLTPTERQSVFALGLPELSFQIEPRRIYPRGKLAAHLLGFTDIDMNGVAGVEQALDARLSEKGAAKVRLSIDMGVQFSLGEELQFGMDKYQAKTASGVVLNIKTGEILAMTSLPDFDPNKPGTASPQSLHNHASVSVYELGSTFKPITMALAHESGVIKDGETLPVQNKLVIRKKSIQDDHPSYVPLDIWDVLAKSSNRGSAILALRAGGDKQQDLLRRLGLFARVPIELKESAAPLLPREWQDITTATVSYGHGISVTPLALATAIGALLNGGIYVPPTVLKRDAGTGAIGRRAVSKQTSEFLVDMMRYVVTNGTGKNARVSGYEVMGKTGTAEKLVDGQYDKTRLVTSFVAAFPYHDPTYLVLIVYDEPNAADDTYGRASAGWNAARTAGAVVERIAPVLGVKRTATPSAQKLASRALYFTNEDGGGQ